MFELKNEYLPCYKSLRAGIEPCHILPYYHLLGGREQYNSVEIKKYTMRIFKKILGWLIVITIYGGAFLVMASEYGTMVSATGFAILFIIVGALVLAAKLISGK